MRKTDIFDRDAALLVLGATLDGARLVLPATDSGQYAEVGQIRRYVRRFGCVERKGHLVFDTEAAARQFLAQKHLPVEPVPTGKQNVWGYFPTPPDLAADCVELLALGGLRDNAVILEPSAGNGHLAYALYQALAEAHRPDIRLNLVELSSDRHTLLQRLGLGETWHTDFTEFTPPSYATAIGGYDAVLMNPPFSTPVDALAYNTHIRRAFGMLRPGGKLVALAPMGFVYNTQRKAFGEFREFVAEHGFYTENDKDAFNSVGTSIATATIQLQRPGDVRRVYARTYAGWDSNTGPTTEAVMPDSPTYDLTDALQARTALAVKLGMDSTRSMPPAEVAVLAGALMREEAARGVPEADRFHLRAYIACPIVVHALAYQAAHPISLPDAATPLPDRPPVLLASSDAPRIEGVNAAADPAPAPATPPLVYPRQALPEVLAILAEEAVVAHVEHLVGAVVAQLNGVLPAETAVDAAADPVPDDLADDRYGESEEDEEDESEAMPYEEEAADEAPAPVIAHPVYVPPPPTAVEIEMAATRARVYMLALPGDQMPAAIQAYEHLFHGGPRDPLDSAPGIWRDLAAVAALYAGHPFPPDAHYTGGYAVNAFSFPALPPVAPQRRDALRYVQGLESDAYQAYARQLYDYFWDAGDHPGYRGSGDKDSRWNKIYADLRALWEAESGVAATPESIAQHRLVRAQRGEAHRYHQARTLRDIEAARTDAPAVGMQRLIALCQDGYAQASYRVQFPDAPLHKGAKKGRR